MASSATSLVCLGAIAGVHGVKGLVRLKSFTARAQDIAAYGPLQDAKGARRFELALVGSSRGALIARIKGIEDRNAAERLKGEKLYVARDRLPATEAGEFYHADLIGLAVEREDGTPLGRIVAVHDFGGGPNLEIQPESGDSVMVPFTVAVVPMVDVAGRRVVVVPPIGLLETPEPRRKGRSR
ncbi:MAG: 16S rRNA processing protein RimM [Alphaproteobacteria bacterium]|nr:16S rRNA processing protein RimM [Alphaproteobacteria bacterium]